MTSVGVKYLPVFEDLVEVIYENVSSALKDLHIFLTSLFFKLSSMYM